MMKAFFLCTENACRSQMAEGPVNHDLRAGESLFCGGSSQPGELSGGPGHGGVGHQIFATIDR